MKKILMLIICLITTVSAVSCTRSYSPDALMIEPEPNITPAYIPKSEIAEATNPHDRKIKVYTLENHTALGTNQLTASEYSFYKSEGLTKALPTITIDFNGEQYTGSFSKSLNSSGYNSSRIDRYNFENGWFEVTADTGELVNILFFANSDESTKVCSVDECLPQVLTLANQYIDTDDYVLTKESLGEFYSFTFQRYLMGIPTTDILIIGTTNYGKIDSFSRNITTGFDAEISDQSETALAIEMMSSQEALDVIEKKIQQLHPNHTDYEIVSRIVVPLENNEYGIVYSVDIKQLVKYPDEEDVYFNMGGAARLLVCVE